MFEWLFPTWTNPAVLALIVGARALVNATLTTLVAESRGPTAGFTIVAAVFTLLSTAISVPVLRGDPGLDASYLEFVVQVALVSLAGYVVYSSPSTRRARATILTAFCAIALLIVVIPLYGEATVAP